MFNPLNPLQLVTCCFTTPPATLASLFGSSREGDGPKLVKRDAPLVPGDRLQGGQYISFCTSILATGCKPKFLEVMCYVVEEEKSWSRPKLNAKNIPSVMGLRYGNNKVA